MMEIFPDAHLAVFSEKNYLNGIKMQLKKYVGIYVNKLKLKTRSITHQHHCLLELVLQLVLYMLNDFIIKLIRCIS